MLDINKNVLYKIIGVRAEGIAAWHEFSTDDLDFNQVGNLMFALSFSGRYGHLINNALVPIVSTPDYIQEEVSGLLDKLEGRQPVGEAEIKPTLLSSLGEIGKFVREMKEAVAILWEMLRAMSIDRYMYLLQEVKSPHITKPVEYIRSAIEGMNKGMDYGVELEFFEDFKLSFLIDPAFLMDLVEIFVSNSVNAMDKEEKRIKVKMRRNDSEMVLEIEDNGIGIPKKDLPLIFSPGHITEDKVKKDINSIGLGLTKAYLWVRLLGGRIVVRSCHGVGTVFTIHIPFSDKVKPV